MRDGAQARRTQMRSIFKKALLMAAVVTLVGATSRASAQDILEANVPFAFTATGKVHPAGKYEFRVINDDATIELIGAAKSGGFVSVMTRMAEPAVAITDGRIVFDKVGDAYILSEMWLPEQDGFMLHAEKARHTHHAVKLERRARKSS
jgi:hypothetical protein